MNEFKIGATTCIVFGENSRFAEIADSSFFLCTVVFVMFGGSTSDFPMTSTAHKVADSCQTLFRLPNDVALKVGGAVLAFLQLEDGVIERESVQLIQDFILGDLGVVESETPVFSEGGLRVRRHRSRGGLGNTDQALDLWGGREIGLRPKNQKNQLLFYDEPVCLEERHSLI